jgi:hypothetical protein
MPVLPPVMRTMDGEDILEEGCCASLFEVCDDVYMEYFEKNVRLRRAYMSVAVPQSGRMLIQGSFRKRGCKHASGGGERYSIVKRGVGSV